MSELNGIRLTPHFTLGEMTKTSYKTKDGNIPSHVAIENLKRLCGWLEMLRSEWNKRYGEGNDPIIINSGYRSWEVNKRAGGVATSNHLVGCAADIKCLGKEQALRYAVILLDIADESQEDFDELIIEVRGSRVRVHFAVRPKNNRRKILFDVK
ncbi:MAG: hypothetical protein IJQ04_00290 [Prevotella sp.]|nr:hypothetical protein [Prevotella sp.]